MLNQTSFLPQVDQDSAGCGVCRDPTHWLVGRAGSRVKKLVDLFSSIKRFHYFPKQNYHL